MALLCCLAVFAVLILAGQAPGWYGNLIPQTAAALSATLSSDFLTMIADSSLHQIRSPLTYAYNAANALPPLGCTFALAPCLLVSGVAAGTAGSIVRGPG